MRLVWMRAQLCSLLTVRVGSWCPGGIFPEDHQAFCCTGQVGKQGEASPETKSLWGVLTRSNQRRKQKPLYILLRGSLTQNSVFLEEEHRGIYT